MPGESATETTLRVVSVDGDPLVVTVSNSDGDGYLAIPDSYAGMYQLCLISSRWTSI